MTAIEWTDETWNPTTGCDRVSPGCDNCYALTMARRLKAMGQAKYQTDGDPRTSGPGFGLAVHPDELDRPLSWRQHRHVFVDSMSDLFHPEVPRTFILESFGAMALASRHTFQVLTKRPQRAARILGDLDDDYEEPIDERTLTIEDEILEAARALNDGRYPIIDWARDEYPAAGAMAWLPNVWLGTSIETDRYTFRADHLRNTPAAIRFLSLEPLLGPLPSLDLTDIDWVIAGGESGPGARPMHPDWVRDIRDRCVAAGVPFFFKQWGEHLPLRGHRDELDLEPGSRPWVRVGGPLDEGGAVMVKVGKKIAGRHLDGRTWDEMP